jgi:hypothetical protein
MKIIWKDIKGFEGIYKISNTGRVVHSKTQAELTGPDVTLTKNNTRSKVKITNIMKTHYPELFVVKEIVTDTLVETLVDVLVKDITGEQKLLVLSIEGIEYTSYREASDKLNLKTSTIKRRVNSKKFEAYLSLE